MSTSTLLLPVSAINSVRARLRLRQRARISLFRLMTWLEEHAERPPGEFGHLGQGAFVHPRAKVVGARYIHLGDGAYVHRNARLEAFDVSPHGGETLGTPRLQLGRGVLISPGAHIGCIGEIVLEDEAALAGGALVTDSSQLLVDPDLPIKRQALVYGGRVVLEYGSVIGQNAVVLPGVTIGRMSYVGANSVVTRDVPPYSIAAGSPARVIRTFDRERGVWERREA